MFYVDGTPFYRVNFRLLFYLYIEITILISARWRIRFPKYVFGVDETYFGKASIWFRRDDTRFKKCAFGVDETLVRKGNLS